MERPKKASYIREYFRIFMGLIVFLVGCLLVVHAVKFEDYGFWFPAVLIIFGAIMLAMGEPLGAILGVLMVLTGGSLLLHQLGLIDIPYARSVVGWLFIIIGGLQLVVFSLKVIRKWKNNDTRDGTDDLDKVDY